MRQRPLLKNTVTHIALRFMAAQFNLRPSLKKYMKCRDGWINFSVGIKSESGQVAQAIIFENGRVRVYNKIPSEADVTMIFLDENALKQMAFSTPNEILNLILKNRMIINGNISCLQLFNFYISLLMGKMHLKMLKRAYKNDVSERKQTFGGCAPGLSKILDDRKKYRMRGAPGEDSAVKYLEDPYLSAYGIEDYPRLKHFFDLHFDTRPEICPERPQLLTRWYRKNGFEKKPDGTAWVAGLRQAHAFKYLMKNKKPLIRENDLIAGTTTSKPVGVTVFPDGQGTMIWGELNSVENRVLLPFTCSKETAKILHNDVLPFWINRNFREYVRKHFNYPLCQKLDERFVAYFVWKSVGISHTIPNLECILKKGTRGIKNDIRTRLNDSRLDQIQKDTLEAMIITLEGVEAYARNLAGEAKRLCELESRPERKAELNNLFKICSTVPEQPARTLDEAVNGLWITWVCLHMENANTGLSLGRLDQCFWPYFVNDMKMLSAKEEKKAYIKHAIDLAGCLIMRLTDHVPLLPDIANYLFGGAASTQAITLGGVTSEGEDAVNDMTYIFLKAVELLPVRDTNINARYHLEKNSDAYLKRLCEVNVITSATPIMQSDTSMLKALSSHGYPIEAINDWAATGCVEPTIQGRHFGHTGSILLNLVAPLEMALNNGRHPLMKWDVGPKTGSIENDAFHTFEDFFSAWETQQQFIIDQAVSLNNHLGEAHQVLRPSPLLSTLIDGCIDNAKDAVNGGATYNSSGTSNIGLADVTDSIMVIKKLVFDEKRITFMQLKKAIDTDFKNDPALHAIVKNRVPLFGSGDQEALDLCKRIQATIHKCYRKHKNCRDGRYLTGYWSMSQHVAYGSLSGTLPSGRVAGKAFTPGLTPSPQASKNFLDNILAVADLNPEHMENNIAFNVKLTPGANDSREKTVDNMHSYVKSYFKQGGMQMQFNVVTSQMLKDAMANPDNYKNLMVRISGYNAYFVTLNKDIQIELIERAEYGI